MMIKEDEIKTYERIVDIPTEYDQQVMALDDGKMFYYYENCLNRDVRLFFTGDDPYTIQIFCSFKKFWDVCNELICKNGSDDPEEFKKVVKNYNLIYKLKSI